MTRESTGRVRRETCLDPCCLPTEHHALRLCVLMSVVITVGQVPYCVGRSLAVAEMLWACNAQFC